MNVGSAPTREKEVSGSEPFYRLPRAFGGFSRGSGLCLTYSLLTCRALKAAGVTEQSVNRVFPKRARRHPQIIDF